MTAIHIREVQPATLEALKRLARAHRRSLQGELHAILDQAARFAPPSAAEAPLTLVTVRTRTASRWGRAEIYADEGR